MGSVATPLWSRTSSCVTLQARHLDDGASCILELSGEADIATLRMLREELAQLATRNREDVVVDVSELVFCDVSCAELILTARRTVPVTVSGATGRVKRVFDLLDALGMQRLPRNRSLSHPQGGRLLHPVSV